MTSISSVDLQGLAVQSGVKPYLPHRQGQHRKTNGSQIKIY